MINKVFPFKDFIYILQLEEYSSKRYLRQLRYRFFRRGFEVRENVKWTSRAKFTFMLSFAVYLIFIFIFIYCLQVGQYLLGIIVIFLSTLSIPIHILIANQFSFVRKVFESKVKENAKKRFQSNKKVKVIAITGSYGKTTTKNFIYEIIKYNYKTQMIPGNINTAIGISHWILENFKLDTEILVVEMGAYFKGEIEDSCKVTPPDIAIITAFGDQHRERFGSFDNLVNAKLEIFNNSREISQLIIPSKIQSDIKRFYKNNITIVDQDSPLQYMSKDVNLAKDTPNIVKDALALAIEVAKILEIPHEFVQDSVDKIELPERRQNVTNLYGFETIDDSYNISLKTAEHSLKLANKLAHQNKKRLITITAGIPELGDISIDRNKKLGEMLESNSDRIILLNSLLMKEVVTGLDGMAKVEVCQTMNEAWEVIKQNYKPFEYVVLMLPELSDQYYL